MNEAVKFVNDGKGYSENDTGVLVGFQVYHTDRLVAIVRLTAGNYVTAPLRDIEYDGD